MRRVKGLLVFFGLGVGLFAGCSVETKASDVICVRDQTDICTDCGRPIGDNRPYRGRHTCASDGKSFGACMDCAPMEEEPIEMPPTEFKPVPVPGPDGGPSSAGPSIDAACNDKLTLVAGKDDPNNQFIYAAVLHDGAFKVFSSSGAPMRSPGSFVVTGHSLMGVYRSKGSALLASTFADGLWSSPYAIAGALTDAAPTMASWGATNKVVFHTSDGRYSAADWDKAAGWSAPVVVGSTETAPPPGTSAPTAAAVGAPGVTGAGIIFGYTDAEGGLYRQDWNGTSWRQAGVKSSVVKAAPMHTTLVTMSGGAFDLVSAWVAEDKRLYFATRTVADTGSLWSNPILVSDDARPLDGATGVGLPNGRAMLVYRDADKRARFTVFDPAKKPQWSAPQELLRGQNPVLASTPQVTSDRCGAEALLSFAEVNGKVAVMRYATDAWKGPFVVSGITDVTYVTAGTVQ